MTDDNEFLPNRVGSRDDSGVIWSSIFQKSLYEWSCNKQTDRKKKYRVSTLYES